MRVFELFEDDDLGEENKGLYYNVNQRKKKGISRPADHPKAPTAQAWKDAAKTAKKESVDEEKQRLDAKCWTGYKKQGTKMKGGVRVNNCVPTNEDGYGDYSKGATNPDGTATAQRELDRRRDRLEYERKQKEKNQPPVEEAEIPSVYSKQVPPGMEHRARYKCPSCGIANKVQDWAANDNQCPTCLEPLPHGLNQMPLKYQSEAVNLDRSKNPNYPNDAATQKHRLDTAKRLLSDPKTDDDSRKEAAAIIARMEPKGKK
jgi:hypothetical protein